MGLLGKLVKYNKYFVLIYTFFGDTHTGQTPQMTWSHARVSLLGVRKLRNNIQPLKIPQRENLAQKLDLENFRQNTPLKNFALNNLNRHRSTIKVV